MTAIAQALEETIGRLDPAREKFLEELVRDAISRAENVEPNGSDKEWPLGFFEKTAGAFANEPFERPDQGKYPAREGW